MKHFQKPTEKTYLIEDIFSVLKISHKEKDLHRNLWKMDRNGLRKLLHFILPAPRVVAAKRVTVIMLCPECRQQHFIPLSQGVPLDMFCDNCNEEENFLKPVGIQVG